MNNENDEKIKNAAVLELADLLEALSEEEIEAAYRIVRNRKRVRECVAA